jgi:CRISPR-associated endonuclease/helicase Cas3
MVDENRLRDPLGPLSRAARSVWAKHDRDTEGWLPLWRHMADSAAVAGRLWDEWLAPSVKRRIGEGLPEGEQDGRLLALWLAAVHDIGKATPAFACQVDGLADTMRAHGLDMPLHRQMADRKLAPHGLAGQLLLTSWLQERHGWSRRSALQPAAIVGAHHGVPPGDTDVKLAADHPALLATPGHEDVWRGVQQEFLDGAARACAVEGRLAAWKDLRLAPTAQVLLSAIVIASDWIASNPELFPLFPDAAESVADRIGDAWNQLDLPRPWTPREPRDDADTLFRSRFSLPPDARVRPVQEAALEAARGMADPGMLIIEAPMGEGKTEAALAAAEVLAARSGAGGCYVALPTMATSNAMFPRLTKWITALARAQGAADPQSVFLAHSKAALQDDYADLMRHGRWASADIDRDGGREAATGELVAHTWLSGRKKGMLASFAVGTIDQLLFAGLKSRHLALRHLALAGKVVVIDEAHAYDTYMNAYLDRVLSWLGAYRVPVVVLSATLPAARRRELAAAYAQARRDAPGFAPVAQAHGYPLLTGVVPGEPPRVSAPAPSGRRTDVRVERLDDDAGTLAERLIGELADGGCVLVVRNTVRRVHATARELEERFRGSGIEVTVAHARFVDLDRAAKDRELLAGFGPPDKVAELGGRRPTTGRVVVASQVAEQSLDIDFDLLVTDLAPIDLMLQRMGRLHRHLRGEGQSERPERLRAARCLVTGADWAESPPKPDQGAEYVYRPYPLLRAAAVLEPHLAASDAGDDAGATLHLPDDIDRLVQHAYGERSAGPADWREALERARTTHEVEQARKAEDARAFLLGAPAKPGRSLIGWVDAGVGDTDDTHRGRAQVRDSADGLEVLVVQRRSDGTLTTLPWLADGRGGVGLPVDAPPSPRAGRTVAASALRLPFPLVRPDLIDRVIGELERDFFPAWQTKDAHWVAGELVLVLDENCRTRLAGCHVTYSPDYGLEVVNDD